MAQDNPFADLMPPLPAAASPVAAPSAPGVIYGRPKQKDPQDEALKGIQIEKGRTDLATSPFDVRKAAADATKAEADARKALAGGDKSATQMDLEAKAEGTEKRANTIRGMMQNVRGLYERDIKGQPMSRAFGALEFWDDMPRNERFTAAGNSLLPLIRPLVAQTAKEGDSDKEMQVFMSYVPIADDSDITIEGKLNALDLLISGMVEGKSPSELKAKVDAAFANQKDGLVTIDGKAYRAGPQETTFPPDNGPSLGEAFRHGAGSVATGIGQVLGIVGNPANATVNAIFGTDLSTDLGRTTREATGLPANPNKVSDAVIQAGTGALAGTGLAGLATRLPGAVGSAAKIAAAQPGRQMAAGMAAGGTGEELKQEGVGPAGQIAGSLVAGGLTYSGGNALASLANRAAGSPNALLAAGQRQGVDILPADVGGPMTRRLTSAAAQAPVSAGPIVNASQRTSAQTRNALARTANREGAVLEPDLAGEQVRAAGKQYVKNESARIGRLYDNAGEAAKGVRIKPGQALSEIDAQTARFAELGDVGAPIVRQLESLRSSIEGGVSVRGMRDARSILSQGVFDGKLRSNQEKKLLGDILEKLSSDIDLGLRQAGREGAAQTFKRADTLWRERIQFIDDTLEPVIGKGKSGEDVLQAVESMTRGQKGGVARLRGILREMPSEQAGDIRATVIDRLGKATAGQQNAEGNAFSSATFLTNWNKMSPRSKAVMFGDERLRNNLDDIAKVAEASKEAGRYANHSNTAGAMTGNVAGIVGIGFASPTVAATALTSQYLTGRLLASPRFTAWLARAPQNPAAQGRYIEQLGVVAAREPAISGDAKALQQYLNDALLNPSGVKAAASENGENPRPGRKQ